MTTPSDPQRVAVVKAELAQRLRKVCAHFEPRDFDALTERMAKVELKYAVRADDDFKAGLGGVP